MSRRQAAEPEGGWFDWVWGGKTEPPNSPHTQNNHSSEDHDTAPKLKSKSEQQQQQQQQQQPQSKRREEEVLSSRSTAPPTQQMPVLSGSSGPSGGPGAAYIVDVVGGSAGVREVNETELDPIQPREFSRAVIWTVGTVPFVFLIGLLAVSYTVYKKGASDTVLLPIEIECKVKS